MSKTIISPVKRWAGTVTLADPLTFPQYIAWGEAITAARAFKDDANRYAAALLPGVFACVEKWELHGFPAPPTPENFPATPRLSSDRLLGWLVREIAALNEEAEEDDPK